MNFVENIVGPASHPWYTAAPREYHTCVRQAITRHISRRTAGSWSGVVSGNSTMPRHEQKLFRAHGGNSALVLMNMAITKH